jgi:hypothetical protein
MPDRLALLLATNCLAPATIIMFALQNRTRTRSAPTQIGVTEPFAMYNKIAGTRLRSIVDTIGLKHGSRLVFRPDCTESRDASF